MKKCLVVDDVEVTLYAASLFLKDLGLESVDAKDEDEALEKIGRENFDVVLLDWHLKKKSGLDLLKIIREKYKNLPVVMFSGVEGDDRAQEAISAGANGFISKPTTKEKIEAEFKKINVL